MEKLRKQINQKVMTEVAEQIFKAIGLFFDINEEELEAIPELTLEEYVGAYSKAIYFIEFVEKRLGGPIDVMIDTPTGKKIFKHLAEDFRNTHEMKSLYQDLRSYLEFKREF